MKLINIYDKVNKYLYIHTYNMKVSILCGGKGLRYNTEKPKGLAMIGSESILQHVMNIYSIQGHNDFTLILGYKSDMIINYLNSIHHNYNIGYEHVNENTNTGGAIQLMEHHISPGEKFLCTYCDSVGNVNISNLISEHNKSKNIATITITQPNHIYGIVKTKRFSNKIDKFEEKPKMKDYINAGFFVFNHNIFNYIYSDSDVLETDVFNRLVTDKKIGAYKHNGFWNTINTLKDEQTLNEINAGNTIPDWYNIR